MRILRSFELFHEDRKFSKYTLKTCLPDMFRFYRTEGILQSVDKSQFPLSRRKQIPIFIGSQFGIIPNPKSVQSTFRNNKYVAILSKSLLSGHVHGLRIQKVPRRINEDRINSVFNRSNTIREYLNDSN